jgi:hypothetical protein
MSVNQLVDYDKSVDLDLKLDMNGNRIKNVGESIEDNDVATKRYVDSVLYGGGQRYTPNVYQNLYTLKVPVRTLQFNTVTSLPLFETDADGEDFVGERRIEPSLLPNGSLIRYTFRGNYINNNDKPFILSSVDLDIGSTRTNMNKSSRIRQKLIFNPATEFSRSFYEHIIVIRKDDRVFGAFGNSTVSYSFKTHTSKQLDENIPTDVDDQSQTNVFYQGNTVDLGEMPFLTNITYNGDTNNSDDENYGLQLNIVEAKLEVMQKVP